MRSPHNPATPPQVSDPHRGGAAPDVNSSVAASHPMDNQMELYSRLVNDFDWLAERLGGWNTADGTALDGLLWKLSHEVGGLK